MGDLRRDCHERILSCGFALGNPERLDLFEIFPYLPCKYADLVLRNILELEGRLFFQSRDIFRQLFQRRDGLLAELEDQEDCGQRGRIGHGDEDAEESPKTFLDGITIQHPASAPVSLRDAEALENRIVDADRQKSFGVLQVIRG
ncbi:MAG: hypothetical protein WCU88_08865 [Elusimicrobiota bacterium]